MATLSLTDLSGRTVKSLNAILYPVTEITEMLPFRIRFTSVQVAGYDPNNPPPVGIAIIGVNNYIL
jgi:hypothetical protein